jgi:predicted nuclease with TOPRIM domain
VIHELKSKLAITQEENRVLLDKLTKQTQINQVQNKTQLSKFEIETAQLSRQNRILENQIQSLQTQVKHVESLYHQSRTNQQPNIQPIVSENQRLISQIAQTHQQQVDEQYTRLLNDLKEIRLQLSSLQQNNPKH